MTTLRRIVPGRPYAWRTRIEANHVQADDEFLLVVPTEPVADETIMVDVLWTSVAGAVRPPWHDEVPVEELEPFGPEHVGRIWNVARELAELYERLVLSPAEGGKEGDGDRP